MSKFTPWFPGTIKPVRVGVYQQQAGLVVGYQKWNGKYWCAWSNNISNAHASTKISCFQNDPWRGLAQDPKGKK